LGSKKQKPLKYQKKAKQKHHAAHFIFYIYLWVSIWFSNFLWSVEKKFVLEKFSNNDFKTP
jgi:glycopeptide antibiotics resistance protein